MISRFPLFSVLFITALSCSLQTHAVPMAETGEEKKEETLSSEEANIDHTKPHSEAMDGLTSKPKPTAKNIDLKEVVEDAQSEQLFPEIKTEIEPEVKEVKKEATAPQAETVDKKPSLFSVATDTANHTRHLLGVDVPPATTTRLAWTPSRSFSGMAVDTPVLVVSGAKAGPTLCLTAAIHGDELNGIEMVRRVLYNLDPEKLHGIVIGVPIVNLLGFSRNSRYLPDRRDLNRYFPGNKTGSVAARLAHSFFNDVVRHCDALVDLHTGSFYRTNIPQLRADLSNEKVAEFTDLFGDIPVLNTSGNPRSLRAAAVRAGIPTVTLEAGEPMRMQTKIVEKGVTAINALLDKSGMYPSFSFWVKPSPAFYKSIWVRANASGILLSAVSVGDQISDGDLLGTVINPITNEKNEIRSVHEGRVLGMALDQFVLPGFAAYHIGIRQPKQKIVEQAPEPLSEEALTPENIELTPKAEANLDARSPEEEGFDD